MNLSKMTATEILPRIDAGEIRIEEIWAACRDRIAEREPAIKALTSSDLSVWDDPRRHEGKLLAGLPVGIKDVIDTAGLETAYGSPIWKGHVPRADATVVSHIRTMGGTIPAKTVTTEFAIRTPGPTVNPWNTAHTPGGSSSGSAASVADGYFPFALGTQTAGSTIRPAAFCGIVGFKPTFATFSRSGLKVMSDSLDTMAVMARSVDDVALLSKVMARREFGWREEAPDLSPRIGICRTASWNIVKPETIALFDRLSRTLAAAGAKLLDFDLPAQFDKLGQTHGTVQFAESAESLSWEYADHRDEISPAMRELIREGLETPTGMLFGLRSELAALRLEFDALADEFDFIVSPAAPGEAPEGIGWTGGADFNRNWTALHVPALAIPAGFGPSGLPLGVQIIAPRGRDRSLLAYGKWMEKTLAADPSA